MKVLYLTHTYLPQFVSGLAITTDIECKLLTQHNIETAVVSEVEKASPYLLYYSSLIKNLLSKIPSPDKKYGYQVFRLTQSEYKFGEILSDFRPNVVIIHPSAMMHNAEKNLQLCKALNIPVILYVLSLQSLWRKKSPLTNRLTNGVKILTNSEYMSNELKDRLNLDYLPEYIYPIVKYRNYQVETSREHVVFINPSPQKGLDIAIRLAELTPDIPYVFVEGWDKAPHSLLNKIDQLKNVTIVNRSDNMRDIYKSAKFILAPTPKRENFFIEAWGRVATEAHVSGIPVIATGECGFSESVGPGGILIPPTAPVDEWLAAVRLLWDNEQKYNEYCDSALSYSRRPEIQETFLENKFLNFIKDNSNQSL